MVQSNTVQVVCCDCGNEFTISRSGYNAHMRTDKIFRCKSCMSKHRTEMMTKFNAQRSPEEKQKQKDAASKSKKQYWSAISKDNKDKHLSKLNAASKEWRENETDEERERISKIHSESNKRRWESMNDEERLLFIQKCKDAWTNKTDKDEFANDIKQRWASYSDEEYQQICANMSVGKKEWWNNVSNDILNSMRRKISNTVKEYWDNLPDTDKDLISLREKDRWNNLPIYSKEELTHRKLTGVKFGNKLCQKFEEYCRDKLESKYRLFYIAEKMSSNYGIMHAWDYGLFDDNGDLELIVDLDGSYFHADNCDYDGIHSKIHYDSKRGLSVPAGIKIAIIYENKFDQSFNELTKILSMTYDEYCDYIFNIYRNIPFPYPSYTDIELMKSYDVLQRMNPNDKYHQSLSVNTRQGDRICTHFHHSIYHDTGIFKVFNDDANLKKLIRNHTLYHTQLNPNKILQGFDVTEYRNHFISAGKAKMIINKYLMQYDEIFDPNSQYSGIMLGTIASGRKFIGIDSSEVRITEANNILIFLRKYGIKFDASISNKISMNKFSCLFTSISDNVDNHIYAYLNMYECERYVFVVNQTEKYRDYIVYQDEDETLVIIDRAP